MGAGCAFLGWRPRSHQTAAAISAIPEFSSIIPSASPIEVRAANGASAVQARSLLAGLPLIFEPNQGQGNLDPADSRAKFVAHGSGYGLFLGAEGAILTLDSRDRASRRERRVDSLEMKLAGANPDSSLAAMDRLPGKSNYLIGNDPSKWRTGVPQFARVRYENVYPGINLVFYGNQGQLEYDFQVAPGADPAKAELEFKGANQLALQDGALVISTEGGSVRLEKPRVYQEVAGEKRAVDGSFVLRADNRAGFAIGSYDRTRELVIDPILSFSTYFGGTGDEHSTSVAIDGSFNIYLTGSTTSADLPTTTGVYQPTLPGSGPNVYVAKITPPLGSLVAVLDYVTYLGGTGQDTPVGIKVDGRFDTFVAGTTSSGDFPTTPTTAYQTSPESAGKQHVFVTELQNDGTALLYSTYLSGNGTDIASGMTIDAGGDVFVTGTTTSVENTSSNDQFPAITLPQGTPYQATSKAPGKKQFFVTKVNTAAPRNASIAYSTYFGGGTFDTTPDPIAIGGGIAVDTRGNAYFTGTTNFLYAGCSGCSTTDFPILDAYQPCLGQAPPGTIVTAPTCSTSTPITETDAFVAKLNLNPNVPQGEQLIWSTFLGGTGTDSSTGVALDSGAANVYVVGTTNSTDIASGVTTLSTSASFQRCLDTPVNPTAGTACTPPTVLANDAFVARLTNLTTTSTTSAVTLNYFSYLGGTGDEAGNAITVDVAGGALVTGSTDSTDFFITPSPSPIQGGVVPDAFVARLNTVAVVGQTTSSSWTSTYGGSGTDSGTGIVLDVNQNIYLAGETNSPPPTLQIAKPLTATQGGGYKAGFDAFVAQLATAVNLTISGSLTLGTNQQFISAGNQATFTYIVTNNGPDVANNITITDNLSSTVTGVPLTFNSAAVSAGTCSGVSTNAIVSCTVPSLQAGSTVTVTIVVTPTGSTTGNRQTFNGGTVQAVGNGNIVLAQVSVPAEMSDFSMKVSPFNQSVPVAGKPANYTVTLSPDPVYPSSISVSCSNLPAGASCVSTPASLSLLSTSSGTINLAVTTTARPVVTGAASFLQRSFYALWFAVPALFFVGIGSNRRSRRIAGIITLCALFTMLLLVPACSSSKTQAPVSGTPSGSYNITVTAASGSDSKTSTIGLTVP